MSQVADLYQVLGLAPSADEAAIKKAFRRLAKDFHPDTHPGDKKAEERFKEISQAYEILSDKEKRQRYDAMRRSPFGDARGAGPGPQGGPWRQAGGASSINDLFEMFFGQGGAARGGFGGFGAAFQQEEPQGQDIESEVWVSFEDAALGRPVTVQLEGRSQPLKLNLPAGAADGLKLRLAGQGQPGRGGRAGDLYLTLRVRPSALFKREGHDSISQVRLNLAQALLGATVTVPTLDGDVRMKVPPGSAAGTRLRLKGKGVPTSAGRGDHLVELTVELPSALSAEEEAAVRAMAAARHWEL